MAQTTRRALEALVESLASDFPHLPAIETVSPTQVQRRALEAVEGERSRVSDTLKSDDEAAAERDLAVKAVEESRKRLELLDREIADESALAGLDDLTRALSNLAPHITDDSCPVCGRDFAEVSGVPLSAHLASEIARLSERTGQLQSGARARLETTTELAQREEVAARLLAKRLDPERRASEERRLSTLTETAEQLRQHEQGARDGGTISKEVGEAEAALSEARRRDHAEAQLREELGHLSEQINLELKPATPIDQAQDLSQALDRRIEQLKRHRTQLVEVGHLRERLRNLRNVEENVLAERARIQNRLAERTEAVVAVQIRTEKARKLLRRVEKIRRATIMGVFNSALNEVWADLFIRLAPDEEYVPAFCEPAGSGPVTARLTTRRRDGTPGGTPGEMLSAGNLNTAALTLFFALHLSVKRRVPWLLLDDPVQSMDEIHVAQFAALLRTLTQREPQRRVFIAVHERALFEYLALELSPASSDGSLITVELRRDRTGGNSKVNPITRSYERDDAVKAA